MKRLEYEKKVKSEIEKRMKNAKPEVFQLRTLPYNIVKLGIMADLEGRTLNKELERIIKKAIEDFENKLENDKI